VYGGAFLGWVVLAAVCLVAWAVAAAQTARQLAPAPRLLRIHAWLGVGVSASMAVMTVAAAVWWAALARVAPWFFDGRAAGSANASVLEPNLVAPMVLMVGAASLGLIGASRAVRAAGKLSPSARDAS
jgi:hypothetical protein